MVTASFHKFTLLPPEIQQQIWTLAAESTAGAHFFTYNDEDEESEITRRNGRIRRTTESEYGPYLALAVPADDRSFVRPTKQKNKDDSVLGTYRDKGGVSRNVIVRSDTDLIILCLTDLSKLSWHRVRDDCPSSVTHLAFVYDPSPSQSGEGPQPSERAKAACNNLAWLAAELCYWPKCVWFIDYSLRRRPDARGSVDELRDEFWCATEILIFHIQSPPQSATSHAIRYAPTQCILKARRSGPNAQWRRANHRVTARFTTIDPKDTPVSYESEIEVGDPHEAYVYIEPQVGNAIQSAVMRQMGFAAATQAPEKLALRFNHVSRHFSYDTFERDVRDTARELKGALDMLKDH
ncbi:hypothetical protein GE09DRAFT_1049901 [Coniochaeta sp. 2T2.1]|nr:hypothetical protein GE09DRAFT_1049901 [Coniochaeta sp. 2T2.1]